MARAATNTCYRAPTPVRDGLESSILWVDRRAFRQLDNAALAHTVRNPTEAAYARSDLFERRRRLMDDWAAYLSGPHGVRPTPAAIGSTSAH